MSNQDLIDDFTDLAGRIPDPPATPLDEIVRTSRRRRRVRTAVATACTVVVAVVVVAGVVPLLRSGPAAAVFLSSPWESEWLDVESVNAAMVDCLGRHGFNAQVEGNGVLIDHPDVQGGAAAQALDVCAQELVDAGVVPDPSAPLPEALVRRIYEERVAWHDCLKENGFPVGEVQPWEEFLEERETVSVDERWNPTAELAEAAGVGAVERAHHVCGENGF